MKEYKIIQKGIEFEEVVREFVIRIADDKDPKQLTNDELETMAQDDDAFWEIANCDGSEIEITETTIDEDDGDIRA